MRLALVTIIAACGSGPAKPASNHVVARGLDSSIRGVDFLNRTYQTAIGDEPPESVTVVNGGFDRPDDPDGNRAGFFLVKPPQFGDLDGDGVEEAVVITVDNGGGTGMFDLARVFAMRGGKAVEIATIPGGDRADGGLHAASIEHGEVRIERYVGGDGACCPTRISVEHWRWTGTDMLRLP